MISDKSFLMSLTVGLTLPDTIRKVDAFKKLGLNIGTTVESYKAKGAGAFLEDQGVIPSGTGYIFDMLKRGCTIKDAVMLFAIKTGKDVETELKSLQSKGFYEYLGGTSGGSSSDIDSGGSSGTGGSDGSDSESGGGSDSSTETPTRGKLVMTPGYSDGTDGWIAVTGCTTNISSNFNPMNPVVIDYEYWSETEQKVLTGYITLPVADIFVQKQSANVLNLMNGVKYVGVTPEAGFADAVMYDAVKEGTTTVGATPSDMLNFTIDYTTGAMTFELNVGNATSDSKLSWNLDNESMWASCYKIESIPGTGSR